MRDEPIEISFDDEDEPAKPGNEQLVITNDDLRVDAGPQVLPGFSSPPPPTLYAQGPYPAAKGKVAVSQVLGSAVWQMAIAGAIGGFLAWMINEPFNNDHEQASDITAVLLHIGLFSGIIGAMIGVCLGAVEGLMTQVYRKALYNGLIGLGVGLVGGFFGGIAGQLLFSALLSGGGRNIFSVVFARVLGWALIGSVVGLGQGIAVRSQRKILNGLLGGLLGGAAGGGLFDMVGMIFSNGIASRMIAITLVGACTGFAIGMVEEITKQAWLRLTHGPLAGKEFILYHPNTVIGSSPKCEITIPKDAGIQPQHCALLAGAGGYELQTLQPYAPTLVNGRPAQRTRLRDGDQIVVGNTAILYSERPAKNTGGYPRMPYR